MGHSRLFVMLVAAGLFCSWLFASTGGVSANTAGETFGNTADGQATDERGGVGDAADTRYVPEHAPVDIHVDIELVPCQFLVVKWGLVPRDICDTYDQGYSIGIKIPDDYNNQNVCFSEVSEAPDPSGFRISDIEIFSPILTYVQAATIYGRAPDPRTDRTGNLPLAVTDYNRDVNPDIPWTDPMHVSFKVPHIENYQTIGGGSNAYRLWDYGLFQGNGVAVPVRPTPNDYAFPVKPTHNEWSEPILAWWKYVDYYWDWSGTIRGWDWDWYLLCIQTDRFGNCTRSVWTRRPGTTRTASWTDSDHVRLYTRKVSTTGLPEGEPFDTYDRELKRIVKNEVSHPSRPSRSPNVPCPFDHCFGRRTTSTVLTETKHDPVRTSDGTLSAELPAFWQIWELWGDRIPPTESPGSDTILVKLKTGHDGDVGPRGIGWIDLGHDYKIDYFWCYSSRNGGWIEAWVAALPYPRRPGTHTNFPGDFGQLTTPLQKPHPQTISGMHTDTFTPHPQSAPSVHIPIPIFDTGSNVNENVIGPDGNWWAVAKTSDTGWDPVLGDFDYSECIDYGGIPVCLAEAYRPWRAVWYVEPPPEDVRAGGVDPAPRDVLICAYSDSDTSSLLADQPREPTVGSHNSYKVRVRPTVGNRSMMHTLQDMKASDLSGLREWLTDLLYGTGTNLARAYGQDQVDPDRYCYYKWWQASNDMDGFRGILAVEWLATTYLGVPAAPSVYCLDNVHPGARYDTIWDPPHSDDYDCGTNLNRQHDVGYRWFRLAAADWTDPDPQSPRFDLTFMNRPLSRISQCYVGARTMPGMGEGFHWFLQGAAIVYDNSQDPATDEPWHPLGGGRIPATEARGNTAPPAGWWKHGSSRAVATPQNNAIVVGETDPDRLYLDTVDPLTYPTGLTDGSRFYDCDQVPVFEVGIPCAAWNSGRCDRTNLQWHGLFGQDSSSPPNDLEGQLWAWWGQHISEVRFSVFPIPVDP